MFVCAFDTATHNLLFGGAFIDIQKKSNRHRMFFSVFVPTSKIPPSLYQAHENVVALKKKIPTPNVKKSL